MSGRTESLTVTCQDLVQGLDEFFAVEMEPSKIDAHDEHLVRCSNCSNYARSYTLTVSIVRTLLRRHCFFEAPERLLAQLKRALLVARIGYEAYL
jgi:hypothetical protein